MRKCYGCLRDIKSGSYCPRCKKELFDGRNIKPLEFDKHEFYEIKRDIGNKMSISGVQDKISLTYSEDDSSHLVPTAVNGRFILKPVPKSHENAINIEDIVANEHISMQISAQIFNIPTAANGIIEFKDGEFAYITKRFDYGFDTFTKEIIKKDQEDFASILEHTEDTHGRNYKYDSSYEAIAIQIKKLVAASTPALENLYKRIVLNYLIANGDAHLKNFSLLRELNRDDYMISPNYDVLNTKYHVPKEEGLMGLDLFENGYETMAYGALGFYSLQDFEEFALLLGIKEVRLSKIFKDILGSSQAVNELVMKSFLSDKAKKEYLGTYHERLEKCLCYSIKSYPFKSKIQHIIDKFL